MHSTKQHVSRSLASLATFRNLALMVAVLAVATALILISTTTQAQASNGAVPNLQLSSASPGELTIAWDAPDPAPSDYRIIWAEQSLDFLSYSRPNEANRGNEYPSGDETSITLTGLAKGKTFKVTVARPVHERRREQRCLERPLDGYRNRTGQGRPAGGAHRSHHLGSGP